MQRLMLVVLLAASCGGKSKPPTTPLPPDNPPVAEEQKPAQSEQKPPEEKAPPVPTGPVEVKIPATAVTVKLVAPGKGKREALKYSAKAGGKQTVELAMDFTYEQSVQGQSQKKTTPTLVLAGAAETKAVDKDGNADFTLIVASADVREVEGAVPAQAFKSQLGSLPGMTLTGGVGANGAAKDTVLHIEKPDQFSAGALDLLRVTLPVFPVLPKEPVGVGAKWQATAQTKLADEVDVTQVTDYELVAHKGGAWTIKTTTKVTGAEQALHDAKISKIAGTGTGEITLTDGALYPTTKQTLETKFTATDSKDPASPMSADFSIKIGSAITAK